MPESHTALVEQFTDPRSGIRSLFEQADDSPSEIDGYIEAGEVLVARCGGEIAGHVQFIRSRLMWEIKSIAVQKSCRRQGIGTALVRSVIRQAVSAGCTQLVVATATADLDNIQFYRTLGFRIDYIEHDVFTPARGYAQMEVNGIPVRDRVWLKMEIGSASGRHRPLRTEVRP